MVTRALLFAAALAAAGCDWSEPAGIPCNTNDNCPWDVGCDLVAKKCVSVPGCGQDNNGCFSSGYPQTPQVAANGQGATLTWGFGGGNQTNAVMGIGILRADAESGPWTVLKTVPLNNGQQQNQATDPGPLTPGHTYWYAIAYAFTPTVVGQLTPPVSFQMPHWASRVTMPTPRLALGAATVNGVIYAIGGWTPSRALKTVEALDGPAGTWTAKADMPTARSYFGAAVVNGVIYAAGGTDNCSCSTPARYATVEAFDPVANAWTTKAPMPTGRAEIAAGVVGGILYAAGGATASTYGVATLEAYDPAADSWSTRASMPSARYDAAAASLNGLLYVAGGVSSGTANRLTTLEAYDPASNSWSTKSPMGTSRQGPALVELGGLLYAVGGTQGIGSLVSVEKYDPATDHWTLAEPLPAANSFMGWSVAGGMLWTMGGEVSPENAVYSFTP